jgi:uncharacterized protein YjcR
MSVMSELDWQIEYMACEDGMSAVDIAEQLGCPIDIVNAWFKNAGIWDEEPLSPYNTNNS